MSSKIIIFVFMLSLSMWIWICWYRDLPIQTNVCDDCGDLLDNSPMNMTKPNKIYLIKWYRACVWGLLVNQESQSQFVVCVSTSSTSILKGRCAVTRENYIYRKGIGFLVWV